VGRLLRHGVHYAHNLSNTSNYNASWFRFILGFSVGFLNWVQCVCYLVSFSQFCVSFFLGCDEFGFVSNVIYYNIELCSLTHSLSYSLCLLLQAVEMSCLPTV